MNSRGDFSGMIYRVRRTLNWSCLILGLCLSRSIVAAQEQGQSSRFIAPDDTNFVYSDYVHLEFVPSPLNPSAKLARFDRLLEMPSKGYRWDNPGARVRFRTDAT